jgi:hypothetical protein
MLSESSTNPENPDGLSLEEKQSESYRLYGRVPFRTRPTQTLPYPTSTYSSATPTHLTSSQLCSRIDQNSGKGMVWSYGVTAVASRAETLLPRTLASLAEGGFDRPHLFVDGCTPLQAAREFSHFGLDMTIRGGSPVRVAGNWVLSLYELYYRNPLSDRYALFQDDFITYVGLREYLETCPVFLPENNLKGYVNLYTMKSNVDYFAPRRPDGEFDKGWYRSNQLGRGAVALVFDRKGIIELLSSRHMAKRPANRDRKESHNRWFMAVDGAISAAMNNSGSGGVDDRGTPFPGYDEYVHYPTLVQHTGHVSSREEQKDAKPQPMGQGFMGEGWDVRQLGKGRLAEGKVLPMPNTMKRIQHVVRDM